MCSLPQTARSSPEIQLHHSSYNAAWTRSRSDPNEGLGGLAQAHSPRRILMSVSGHYTRRPRGSLRESFGHARFFARSFSGTGKCYVKKK